MVRRPLRNVRKKWMSANGRARRVYRTACGRVLESAGVVRAAFRGARRRVSLGALGVAVLTLGVGSLLVAENDPAASPASDASANAAIAAETPTVRRWLDGTAVDTYATQDAIAVIIDHAPEARPQEGLAAAPLVVEVPVEGQRTRFLAVYPSDADVGSVGPVRSARPYLVGLAEALDVPLSHVGGSEAALKLLRRRPHIDQYYDPPFWRTRSRPAPFNVQTAVSDLAAFATARGWLGIDRSSFALWAFAGEKDVVASQPGTTVRIAFGRESAFDVTWAFDLAQRAYVRMHEGVPTRDVSGDLVTAVNVVILHARSRVLDRVGRLGIPSLTPPIPRASTTPQDATVLTGDRRWDGTWQWSPADSAVGRFGLRDASGAPIALAPGTTWVEIVNVEPEFDGMVRDYVP